MKTPEEQFFIDTFDHAPTHLFSAPGRTELGGNHTDHQNGLVLAAAVDLEALAWVGENGTNIVRVLSQGYPLYEISLDDLEPKPEEVNTTPALIRGVLAEFSRRGCHLRGFDAYVTSQVLPGSGLSSSAAFEVLMGTICNHLFYEEKCSPMEIARMGKNAENVYFGKPCGLMDQAACASGGIVAIDFQNVSHPVVEKVNFDFARCGYALCIIDSGADHADLTAEYAAIPGELKAICHAFGKEVLRELPEEEFFANLPLARKAGGDRGVLRAIHVYEENKRVRKQAAALKRGDVEEFLSLVTESGNSSWMYLQNVIPRGSASHQELAFSLALAKRLLKDRGACRVHGGGFAGTVGAFVPTDMLEEFQAGMERNLRKGCCHVLSVRQEGGRLVRTL